jgi:DIS3-like exonuclease 2
MQGIMEKSNDMKYAARIANEKSCELFFAIFINECGPLEEHAFVTMIQDHSFDVLINNLGVIKRIYCDVSSKPQLFFHYFF